MVPPSATLTDRYELSMVASAIEAGIADRPAVFEVFARGLPPRRRFGVVAGVGRLAEELEAFRFSAATLDGLLHAGVIDADVAGRLDGWRFTGTVSGYPDGEAFLPYAPVLRVDAPFADGLLIETLALSVLNHDAAIATKAAAIRDAAGSRTLIEMGSRRTHEQAAVAAAAAAYIAGFDVSSNIEAGLRHQVPTAGTAAHAWLLAMAADGGEAAAFAAQMARHGVATTLLVDTFDIASGIRTAVAQAKLLGASGPGAVRIDSGDLAAEAHAARRLLDGLGATDTGIVVSSDLDETSIAALAGAPVDGYGVGTKLVATAPAGFVYKLTSIQAADGSWSDVAKSSPGKVSVGGAKRPWRLVDDQDHPVAELLVRDGQPDPPAAVAMHRPVFDGGLACEGYDLEAARLRYRNTRAAVDTPIVGDGLVFPVVLDGQTLAC